MNAKPSKMNWSQIMKDSCYPMSRNVGFILHISMVPIKKKKKIAYNSTQVGEKIKKERLWQLMPPNYWLK